MPHIRFHLLCDNVNSNFIDKRVKRKKCCFKIKNHCSGLPNHDYYLTIAWSIGLYFAFVMLFIVENLFIISVWFLFRSNFSSRIYSAPIVLSKINPLPSIFYPLWPLFLLSVQLYSKTTHTPYLSVHKFRLIFVFSVITINTLAQVSSSYRLTNFFGPKSCAIVVVDVFLSHFHHLCGIYISQSMAVIVSERAGVKIFYVPSYTK